MKDVFNHELIASSFARAFGIPHVIARIATQRGVYTMEEMHTLLHGNPAHVLDPFSMKGMKEAVQWVSKIKESGEAIFIFGDYDLDGLSSVALLVRGLRALGIETRWRLPSRFESGYGLSCAALDEMLHSGAKNLITVDTGVTANAEIEYAQSKGMRVMVIDHHQPSGEGLPACDVLLDPHQEEDSYRNEDLCGVGVAYKFLSALYETYHLKIPEAFLELVALGTLADLVAMTPENRYFTRIGLSRMWNSEFPGIRALCRAQLSAPQFVGAQGVIFRMAPLLNAPGRMERPDPALELLLTDDSREAERMVETLDKWNKLRKNTENAISEASIARVKELYGENLPPVLIIDGEGYHLGVIGIVAAKLSQEFSRPAAVVSIQADGSANASARAVPGFNWHQALFDCRALFSRWGGHAGAAGFSLPKENIETLRNTIIAHAENYFTKELEVSKPLTIDVALSELNDSVMDFIFKMEPLVGNFPTPIFRAKNVQINRIRTLRGGHLQMELSQKGSPNFSAIAFGKGERKDELLAKRQSIQVDFELAWNVYNGRCNLQLQIKDIF